MKMKVMITIVRQFGDDVIEAIEGRGTGEIMTDKLSGELVSTGEGTEEEEEGGGAVKHVIDFLLSDTVVS